MCRFPGPVTQMPIFRFSCRIDLPGSGVNLVFKQLAGIAGTTSTLSVLLGRQFQFGITFLGWCRIIRFAAGVEIYGVDHSC